MEYFAALATVTLVILVLAVVLFRLTRDPGILAGIGALYYWSLFGAWYVIIDKTGGFSGKAYHYLEYKMFPVALDGNSIDAIGNLITESIGVIDGVTRTTTCVAVSIG